MIFSFFLLFLLTKLNQGQWKTAGATGRRQEARDKKITNKMDSCWLLGIIFASKFITEINIVQCWNLKLNLNLMFYSWNNKWAHWIWFVISFNCFWIIDRPKLLLLIQMNLLILMLKHFSLLGITLCAFNYETFMRIQTFQNYLYNFESKCM